MRSLKNTENVQEFVSLGEASNPPSSAKNKPFDQLQFPTFVSPLSLTASTGKAVNFGCDSSPDRGGGELRGGSVVMLFIHTFTSMGMSSCRPTGEHTWDDTQC